MGIRGSRQTSIRARLGSWAIACMAACVAMPYGSAAHAQGIASPGIPTSRTPERRLAPDALFQIPPAMQYGETFQGPIDLPLLAEHPDLAWDPHYAPKSDTLAEMARDVVFRNDVYCLDFAFKAVRTIEVQGEMVWYMVYRIRYLGGELRPKVEPDAYQNQVFATPEKIPAGTVEQMPGRFLPLFRLQVRHLNKEYLDQIIPGAKAAIAARERISQPLLDSVEIQTLPVKLWRDTDTIDNSLWGVATWTGIDSRTDFFSVQVAGLTNAQRLKQDGKDIKYLQKNLVLNFSRPGDSLDELEDRIRYGVPALSDPQRQQYVLKQYGLEERLDHLWIYR